MSADKYPSIFSGQIETIVYLPYSNSQLDNQKPSLLSLRYQVTDLNAKFWAEFGYGKYLIVPFLRLAKIRTISLPNSPDEPSKRTKKVRLGVNIVLNLFYWNLELLVIIFI